MDSKFKTLLIAVFFAGCLAACNKKNDDAPVIRQVSRVNVINASFNTINFYLNGTRINNTSSFYPGGTLGYLSVTAGAQNYEVKIAGSTEALFTVNYNLSKDTSYSVYVAGTTTNDIFKTADEFSSDTNGFAKIRFVNASPDAGSLDVKFEGTANRLTIDTVKFDGVPYKTSTPFITVKSGVHNFGTYQASTLLNRDTINLNPGRVYTYYGYGNIKGTGSQGLGTGLITNQ